MERGVEVAGWKKYKRRLRAKRAEWVEHRHLIGRMTGQEGLGGWGVEEEDMTRPKMRLKRAKGGCMTGENHDTPKMTALRRVT